MEDIMNEDDLKPPTVGEAINLQNRLMEALLRTAKGAIDKSVVPRFVRLPGTNTVTIALCHVVQSKTGRGEEVAESVAPLLVMVPETLEDCPEVVPNPGEVFTARGERVQETLNDAEVQENHRRKTAEMLGFQGPDDPFAKPVSKFPYN
jgi:hypothetical protein